MNNTPQKSSQAWPDKFELLDGFRGIAASGVVLHHLNVADIGHYCVMMFFVISGYCITASAVSGSRKGTTTRSFIHNRIRRIYPPYLLAVAFFATTRLVRFLVTGEPWTPSLTTWLQNLTLTQWFTLALHPMAEAPQNPALFVAAFWSLNYEIQFYLVMAVGLSLARYRSVPLVQFVGALTLIAMVINLGWPALAVRGIFIEYWAHFGLGAGLYFLLCGSARRWSGIALVLLFAFVIWQLLEMQGAQCAQQQRVFSEYAVSVGAVLMLLLLRPYDAVVARTWFWRPISAIGTISYSLYLVHQFNLTAVAKVASRMLPPTISVSANLWLQFALHLLVAAVFWAFCERPFQRTSKSSPHHRSPSTIPQTAARRP
jgi:peptidoglycan/LPS O-acetylase OafA/YrhL